jgi:OOP family OmpA-OmpF porin
MRRVLFTAVFVSLFVFNGTGVAQIVEQSSELTPYVGIISSRGVDLEVEGQKVGELESETSVLFGVRYAYNFNLNSALEGRFGVALPENAKVYLYDVNYRYNFALDNEMVYPYITGGAGAATTSPDEGDSGTDLIFNFGGGFGYFVTETVAIRADVRDVILRAGEQDAVDQFGQQVTVEGYTQHNIEATGGVTYSFY